jgi:alpha-L-rhamnosidase
LKKGFYILLAFLLVFLSFLPSPKVSLADNNEETAIRITKLKTEYMKNPIGIDVKKPRLSWEMEADKRSQEQTSYQVLVASSLEKLKENIGDVWDTRKVDSDQSVNVEYNGTDLQSGKTYFWKVRVWDKKDVESNWSQPATFEMGLLQSSDWKAKWVEFNNSSDQANSIEKYNLDLDFTVLKDVAGVIFGAKDQNNYYMWQINTTDGNVRLRPHKWVNGSVSVLKEVDIPSNVIPNDKKLNTEYHLKIAVDKDKISTYINNQLVDTTTDASFSYGDIGFREDGAESALFDNVKISNNEGTVLWSEEFLEPEQISFNGGSVVDGKLKVMGQYSWQSSDKDSAPQLRKEFSVSKEIERARVYSSALGLYELNLNGEKVGADYFAPGWTDYNKRVQYQTYDVTKMLKQGKNAIGAILGEGWYAGKIAWFGKNQYGNNPALLMQLVIEYSDGTKETITTDNSWKAAKGPIIANDIYAGETYDARKELNGWNQPGYDDSGWKAVKVKDDYKGKLVAQADPPVQVEQEIKPKKVTEPKPGVFVFDLGQNMVGSVRLKVKGNAGKVVTIRHGEVLSPDGTVYTANLRSAEATDRYILKGEEDEVYEPRFTFHGFRYVEITGYPGTPTVDAITGRVMHTAAPFTGKFETSSDMLNQLQSNITWGQRGNFLSIPTDTPARDERLGWTGDINVFIGAATFNMNVAKFLGTKWLTDLRDAQSADGAFPDVAPKACCGEGSAGWGDAGVTVPYTIWQRYGDTRVIEENYDAMVKWIDYLKENSNGYIRPNSGYGDWLNINDNTPNDFIGTAYFAYSTKLLSEMAKAIGKEDDAQKYEQLFNDIKTALIKSYVLDDGRLKVESQTGYVLALYMDLLPDSKRKIAAERLVDLIKSRDWHLSTGFLGTRDLLPVLAENGYLDVAYRLLNNDTFPSWGYQIKNGATTMWERWDSIKPDGTFQDVGMNSFNHYAYGAVGDWMYQNIAGIQPEPKDPGYKSFIIKPRPGGNLTHAKGEYDSEYGKITSDWKYEGDVFNLSITVPVNTTSTVYVPAENKLAVVEARKLAETSEGVKFLKMEDGNAVFAVGSGAYHFISYPVLGKLGSASDKTGELQGKIRDLVKDDKLKAGQEEHLTAQNDKLINQIQTSIKSFLAKDQTELITQVQHSLSTANSLNKWVETQKMSGHLDESSAKKLSELISGINKELTEVSTELLGIQSELTITKEKVLPGETFRVNAALQNTGKESVNNVQLSLNAPDGWSVSSVGSVKKGVLKQNEKFTAEFDVKVPTNQPPMEDVKIEGNAAYKKLDGTANVQFDGTVTVDSPVKITSVQSNPEVIGPNEEAIVLAKIQNKGLVSLKGEVQIKVPEKWKADTKSQAYDLAVGEEQTVQFKVTSPIEASENDIKVELAAAYNGNIADTRIADIKIRLTNPPVSSYDHIDIGEAQSEKSHNLTASAGTGTSVEAGLTRRYTGYGVANGYFQFNMKVEPGKPFIIRAIETYDREQIKDYYILVNGVKVYSRENHTTSGGTVTYQFVVDDLSLTQSGNVTVRFQEDEEGRNYDPSIADVWTMPMK